MLILVDSRLEVAYCSDSFLRILGAQHIEDIENRNVLDVYKQLAQGSFFEELANMLALAVGQDETSHHDIIIDISGSGNQRAYRVTNTPMLDKTVNGVIITWDDITDITEAKNKAEEASKSKSSFLATMSHEIRTPLNAILGIAQIQMQRSDIPDEYFEAFEKINNSGTGLLGIINDILDLSKIETGKLELAPAAYDLPSLINDALQLNIVRIGSKPIDFILDLEDDLPSGLFGDELRLKQILSNLLSNAVKYTEKGHVKLSVHSESTLFENEIVLIFKVEDTGQGMKPVDVERLFTQYVRFNMDANRSTEGTGLGLHITKQLTEMMGGDISVSSQFGKGSVFTVTLTQKVTDPVPIGKETAARLCSFSYNNVRMKDRRKTVRCLMPYGKVLVVDDVDSNLYVAVGHLNQYKLQIETANNGYKAIDKVKEGAFYDIIFMDHMMPGMDGIETTKKIRGLGYKGIIVALTANALIGNDRLFIENGFDGYISKPIEVRRLDAILNKFVRDAHPEEAEKYKSGTAAAEAQKADPKTDLQLQKIFTREAKRAITVLRETSAGGDIKLFTTTAHGIKSALANVGETEASAKALALEKAGQRGDTQFIEAETEAFFTVLEGILEKLQPQEESSEPGAAGCVQNTELLKQQLGLIADACGQYDSASAYTALDCLGLETWNAETSDALETIRNAIFLDSDFEEAAALAAELMGKQRPGLQETARSV